MLMIDYQEATMPTRDKKTGRFLKTKSKITKKKAKLTSGPKDNAFHKEMALKECLRYVLITQGIIRKLQKNKYI